MNQEEKQKLLDLAAYIMWAVESEQTYFSVLGTIGHDVGGLFNTDDTMFLPRTRGYTNLVKNV